MQIEDYFKLRNMGVAEFSAMIGCKHRNIVSRWILNQVVPNKTYQKKIKEVTNGLVTPIDWGVRLNDTLK